MEKKINVKNFVDGYNRLVKQNADVEEYVGKHITKKYLNYDLKCTLCDNIIKISCYEETESGKMIFKQDSSARYYLWCLTVIENYTDIEMGKNEERLKDFDLLNECRQIDVILQAIGEREIEELSTILEMKLNDIIENERSFGNLSEKFELIVDNIINVIQGVISSQIENNGDDL